MVNLFNLQVMHFTIIIKRWMVLICFGIPGIQKNLPVSYLPTCNYSMMCRLHVDSLIIKNGEYYLKKQTEKTNRGNSHEIPILEVSAYLFLLWKKERDTLLGENATSIISLWINTNHKHLARSISFSVFHHHQL